MNAARDAGARGSRSIDVTQGRRRAGASAASFVVVRAARALLHAAAMAVVVMPMRLSAAGESGTAAGLEAQARSAQAPADAPRFGLPIRCRPGEDCFVQNYFDRDPGPGWRDYACGALSYDGHHGTDFRVPSLVQMDAGVEVIAAAAGRVVALRDGEPDRSVRERGRGNLGGRDAGNGVRIEHGGGWETQYSHLKRGSIRVRAGERVEAGAVLGLVGLSGNTEFPHVDFVVRRDGRALDPFDPQPPTDEPGARECPAAPTSASVWRADVAETLRYHPSGVLISGFAAEAADRDKAQRGGYRDALGPDAPVLVFFVETFGLRRGDAERFELIGPDGRQVIGRTRAVERDLAVRFAFVGKRRSAAQWPPGVYVARYVLERDGRSVAATRRELVMR